MKKQLPNARSVMAGIVVLCVVLSLLPSRILLPITNVPASTVQALMSPVTDVLSRLMPAAMTPADINPDRGDAATIEQRYDEARVYISRLEQQVARLTEENRLLSQVTQVMSIEGIQRLTARVTASHPDALNPRLVIGRGERDTVRPLLTVVDGINLVGQITQVGTFTSTVRLVNAPGTRLAVQFVPPEPRGQGFLFRAEITADKSGHFTTEVGKDDPIAVGDWVHLDDDRWPMEARGFVVGKVQAIEPAPENPLLKTKIVIAPLRPLQHLRRVVVLLPVAAEAQ